MNASIQTLDNYTPFDGHYLCKKVRPEVRGDEFGYEKKGSLYMPSQSKEDDDLMTDRFRIVKSGESSSFDGGVVIVGVNATVEKTVIEGETYAIIDQKDIRGIFRNQ